MSISKHSSVENLVMGILFSNFYTKVIKYRLSDRQRLGKVRK